MSSEKKIGGPEELDYSSDPEIMDAVSQIHFAWGQRGDQARARYLELMQGRGVSEEKAKIILAHLSTIPRYPDQLDELHGHQIQSPGQPIEGEIVDDPDKNYSNSDGASKKEG